MSNHQVFTVCSALGKRTLEFQRAYLDEYILSCTVLLSAFKNLHSLSSNRATLVEEFPRDR